MFGWVEIINVRVNNKTQTKMGWVGMGQVEFVFSTLRINYGDDNG